MYINTCAMNIEHLCVFMCVYVCINICDESLYIYVCDYLQKILTKTTYVG